MSTLEPEYKLCTTFTGAKGPVNALVFSSDGTLLLSGGDDECVRVWNTSNFRCEQVIQNPKGGQVTSLTWITVDPPTEEKTMSICMGTGRGHVSICPTANESTWFLPREMRTHHVFEFNDAVETQAYDQLNLRLVVASHSGIVKLFAVDQLNLTPMWSSSIPNAIPRGLRFFRGASQSLLIHGLETGEMSCRDAQTSNVLWTKTLAGGIRNATLSPDEATLLVDNLTTGLFDLYRFPASTPTSAFPLAPTRKFTKQIAFAEEGRVAVCGSDAGRVHVLAVGSSECIQTMHPENERGMIQTVAAVAASAKNGNRHLLAGGSNGVSPGIHLWQKQIISKTEHIPETDARTSLQTSMYPRQAIINVMFAVLIVLVSYPNWSPLLPTFMGSSNTASYPAGTGAHPTALRSAAPVIMMRDERAMFVEELIPVHTVPVSIVTVTITQAIHTILSPMMTTQLPEEQSTHVAAQTVSPVTVTVTATPRLITTLATDSTDDSRDVLTTSML